MRGTEELQDEMFSYVPTAQRIPADHPLRPIRKMVDEVFQELSPKFDQMYSRVGRPSIPPEQLLRALLIQVLYTVRSERMLMEQLNYNLLFRWFVGLRLNDAVWDVTVFSKNRDRLLAGEVAEEFFSGVVELARKARLLSNEHFTVDGTLIEAWAGQKSFRRKGEKVPPPDDPGNPTVNYHGQERRNDTHQSTTDPEARLYRKSKGKESKLCFLAHLLMDNKNGLAVNTRLTTATGRAEREAAVEMIEEQWGWGRITLGADKGYDTKDFIRRLRQNRVTPHVAQNTSRRSAIDERTTRQAGYGISQKIRKQVEEIFGWIKTVGMMRKTRHRGKAKVGWMFTFTAAAYNLIRIRNLVGAVS